MTGVEVQWEEVDGTVLLSEVLWGNCRRRGKWEWNERRLEEEVEKRFADVVEVERRLAEVVVRLLEDVEYAMPVVAVVLDEDAAASEMGGWEVVVVVEVMHKEMAMETAFRENCVTGVCKTPSTRQLLKMAIAAAQSAAELRVLKYVGCLKNKSICRMKSCRDMRGEGRKCGRISNR